MKTEIKNINVLVCAEPRTRKFFMRVAEYAFYKPQTTVISEYKNCGEIWTGIYLYSKKYDNKNDKFENEWSDIYPRSLVFRLNSEEKSHIWAQRIWNGIEELFEKQKFNYVLMPQIDRYLYDIIERIARNKNVVVVGFVSSIFTGYCRMALRGEYSIVRKEIDESEVEEHLRKMSSIDFMPDSEKESVKRNHMQIIKHFYKRKVIENVYYPLMKILHNDPSSHKYNLIVRRGKHLNDYYRKDIEKYFTHVKDIEIDRNTTIYLPLHLIPEATTSYQCTNAELCYYENFILNLIQTADPVITFIVKEHPAMYGMREISFYNRLLINRNVILVHPKDKSNQLLEKVETILTDNGTVGVEALLRKKRVLILNDNCYYIFHPNAFLVKKITVNSLKYEITDYDNKTFIRKLLQSVDKSDFICNTRIMSKCSPMQLGTAIKKYLELNNNFPSFNTI